MEKPIGIFDSGLGGISVLAQMLTDLPKERYVYFGDSKNAPYGEKTKEEVLNLSKEAAEKLYTYNVKSMVVACNTATSAAIKDLRKRYDIPIIGMEPAVKPALNVKNIHRVVVMATPFTLREKKFHELVQNLDINKRLVKLPCPGLVQLIEQYGGTGSKVYEYLNEIFRANAIGKGDVMVLGCTHYVFLSETIKEMLKNQVPLIHGNIGTVHELKNQLEKRNILSPEGDISTNQRTYKESERIPLNKQQLEKHVRILNSHNDSDYSNKGWRLLLYELNKLGKKAECKI